MASFSHEIVLQHASGNERGRIARPSFSSQKTADRLRECERSSSRSQVSKIKPHRTSVFKEEGLDDLRRAVHVVPGGDEKSLPVFEEEHVKGKGTKFEEAERENEDKENAKKTGQPWYSKLARGSRPSIKTSSTAPPGSFASIPRVALIACLIAVVVPGFRYGGEDKVNINGADAGVIREAELVDNAFAIEGRQNSPTSICMRWSHQVANVNGTVYVYGGQATTQSGQTANTWNNDFLTLDLTKTWKIASPSLLGLPQPSGPPAVAMGSLWNSYDALWLYGGEFSDNPSTSPLPVSTWEYNIKSSSWTQYSNPQTSVGNNSDGGNQPVQRAAEGAGLSVPELGKSWYFGGHLDMYTTEGWSNQIARVYLKSLLEFTHPGYANTGVASLGSTTAAGSGGVYRNITEGGLQAEAGFTERADGVLVYVPGWGDDGIILGLAGGTNETFTEMNVIDVYDIANSTWYKQATSGPSPPIRVDPCAVVAAAPDGTSFNIYLYGGQNLIPFGSQIQYSDMWILTIPSFTWIQVDMTGQSQPPARAGHSCVMWDGQLVVIGGYVGKDISCDSPGIYVFNASSLQWTNSFTSISTPSESFSTSQESSVLQGSIGYAVPAAVQSVIGGSSQGGATATTPAAGSATAGPIATGKPPTFTITQSGSTVIQTAHSTSTVSPGSSSQSSLQKAGPNIGAIIAGTIAAALAILAVYLAFCTWLYRKQLRLYKNHVTMAQRTAFANSPDHGNWGSEMASGNGSGGRINEKVGTGVMLGPFGTEIGGSGSAGRPSVGESAGSLGGSGLQTVLTPSSGITPGSGPAGESGSSSMLGGGLMPGRGQYEVLNEEQHEGTEYLVAGAPGPSYLGRPSGSTAHSSMEDLIGGQEPSFFSVVLNPRRTLRVVNLD